MKQQFNWDAGFLLMDNLSKKFWDYWKINMDTICYSQKQLDTILHTFMEQHKLNKEERRKFRDNIWKQFGEKQAEMCDIAAKSWDIPSDKHNFPGSKYLETLNWQMAFSQQIENQQKFWGIAQQARDSFLKTKISNPIEQYSDLREKTEVLLKLSLESQQKIWKMGKEAFQASMENVSKYMEKNKPGGQ